MEHKLVISGEDFLWLRSAHGDGLLVKMWIFIIFFKLKGKHRGDEDV